MSSRGIPGAIGLPGGELHKFEYTAFEKGWNAAFQSGSLDTQTRRLLNNNPYKDDPTSNDARDWEHGYWAYWAKFDLDRLLDEKGMTTRSSG